MEGKEFDYFISFKTFLDQYSKENNTVYCMSWHWLLLTAGLPNIQIKDCLKIQNHFQQSLNIHMQSMFANSCFYINGCQGPQWGNFMVVRSISSGFRPDSPAGPDIRCIPNTYQLIQPCELAVREHNSQGSPANKPYV